MPKLNVLVAGSTGYIGVQLIKLLVKHKNINIKYFIHINHLFFKKVNNKIYHHLDDHITLCSALLA